VSASACRVATTLLSSTGTTVARVLVPSAARGTVLVRGRLETLSREDDHLRAHLARLSLGNSSLKLFEPCRRGRILVHSTTVRTFRPAVPRPFSRFELYGVSGRRSQRSTRRPKDNPKPITRRRGRPRRCWPVLGRMPIMLDPISPPVTITRSRAVAYTYELSP